MKNINSLSDHELSLRIKELIQREREVLNQILDHLQEVEKRKLYLKMSYPSLFEYCTKELGYSESAAQRRISSMRLIKEIPEIKDKIQSGSLSLMTISLAQSFLRKEEKENKKIYTKTEKKNLISSLEKKSKREVEKALVEISPVAIFPKEKERALTPEAFEIRMQLTNEQIEKLRRLKILRPDLSSNSEALEWLLNRALKQIDPLEKNEKGSKKSEVETLEDSFNFRTSKCNSLEKKQCSKSLTSKANTSKRRYIPQKTKREVWQDANGQCEFVDSTTGKRCSGKAFLQIDHIQPVSMGGGNKRQNLRLLCQQHNLFEATRIFGTKKISKHVSK